MERELKFETCLVAKLCPEKLKWDFFLAFKNKYLNGLTFYM